MLTIVKRAISQYELYSTFDYNISILSSLPQPSSLPTFDRSPPLSSYKSPNSSSDIIKSYQLPVHQSHNPYVQHSPPLSLHNSSIGQMSISGRSSGSRRSRVSFVQFFSPLHRSYSVGHMSTGGRSSVHSAGSRGSRGSVGSRCSAY